jgi:hypothetical protein
MTVFNPAIHQQLLQNTTTGDFTRLWALDTHARMLGEAGLIDLHVGDTTPSTTEKVWLDPANPATSGPGTVKIYNRTAGAWQSATQELFAQLLQRDGQLIFNGASPPTAPTIGTFWIDPATLVVYQRVNDGTGDLWMSISTNGQPEAAGTGTFPTSPTNGQTYRTPAGYTYRYAGTPGVWNLVGRPSNIITTDLPVTGTDPILFDNLADGIYELQGSWTNAAALSGSPYETMWLRAIRANAIDYTSGMTWDTTIWDAGTDSFVPNPTFGVIRICGATQTTGSSSSVSERIYSIYSKFNIMGGRLALLAGWNSGGTSGTEVTMQPWLGKPVTHSSSMSSIVTDATGVAIDLNQPSAHLPNASAVVWKSLVLSRVG